MLKTGYSGVNGTIKGAGIGGRRENVELREGRECRWMKCGLVGDRVDRNVRLEEERVPRRPDRVTKGVPADVGGPK